MLSARALAEQAIREEAKVKNHPPDLINVALELLVRESLELPGFSTLDEMAARVRTEVNAGMFAGILALMSQGEVLRINGLLEVVAASGKSRSDALKRAAGKASWSNFREQVAHMVWVDSLGNTACWLEGIAESKIADFAVDAAVADAAVMRDVAQPKRTALLACLVRVAQTRARDELAEMFCKRLAAITKRARSELEALREQGRGISERLIEHYRELLGHLDPRGPAGADAERTLAPARATIAQVGGFEAELEDIESVAAHHQNNYMPLVYRQLRRDRATMFAFARTVELEPTSGGPVGAGRAGARGRPSASDARPDPRPPAQSAGGCVVRQRSMAAADQVAQASRPAGPSALRGVRIHVPGRTVAHRRCRCRRRDQTRTPGRSDDATRSNTRFARASRAPCAPASAA